MRRALPAIALLIVSAPSFASSVREPAPSRQPKVVALRVHPARVVLDGRESRRQLIVDGIRADGRIVDLTSVATFGGDCPGQSYRMEPGAVVRPTGEGTFELNVSAAGLTASV